MSNPTVTASNLAAALDACQSHEPGALDRLVSLLYPELRKIARSQLRRLRPGQTIDTTGLVHETYLKMVGLDQYENRRHFLAASARAMRFILVDAARRRVTKKRGGGAFVESLDEELVGAEQAQLTEWIEVSNALAALSAIDERLSTIVDCRFFAGMTEEETGEALGVSGRTVRRDWKRARAWLKHELTASVFPGPST